MDRFHFVNVPRLLSYFDPSLDFWGVGFYPELIDEVSDTISIVHGGILHDWSWDWNAEEHAFRIRYMIQNINQFCDPISIDSECSRYQILPIPVMEDGCHRLVAHKYLELEWIPAYFGGLVCLLDYLTCKTDERPEV